MHDFDAVNDAIQLIALEFGAKVYLGSLVQGQSEGLL